MSFFTTKTGTEYVISGMLAWPVKDPNQHRRWGYDPSVDWGAATAASVGLLVDASLPSESVKVRKAGSEWLEVYQHIRGEYS
jgi:hypothetical protein